MDNLAAGTTAERWSERYIRAVQLTWLGNQLSVQFFVLAAPTILKARHAPVGTLTMFAAS